VVQETSSNYRWSACRLFFLLPVRDSSPGALRRSQKVELPVLEPSVWVGSSWQVFALACHRQQLPGATRVEGQRWYPAVNKAWRLPIVNSNHLQRFDRNFQWNVSSYVTRPISWKRRLQSTRQSDDCSGVISHAISATNLKWLVSLFTKQSLGIPNTRPTCPYIGLRAMDTVSCWNVWTRASHVKWWQDHIRNTEVATLTGFSPVSEFIIQRRNSLFRHVTRLAKYTPARTLSVVSLTVTGTDGSINFVRTTSQQHSACWPLATSLVTWTFGGDATVLADYPLTTTANSYLEIGENNLQPKCSCRSVTL